MEQAAYKLSIVLFTDEADPADLLQAIQDAGESIASDYDGDCPEMDGANGMVQCLDDTPTSNTITLGSTKLARVQRERDELLAALERLSAWGRMDEPSTSSNLADIIHEANAAIAQAGGA